MVDTLAERVIEELQLRSVPNDRLGEENLLVAVTPFPNARVHQLQVAEIHARTGGEVPFVHYVREVITLPFQAQPNLIDYLVQPSRSGHTRTSQRRQNPHAVAVTPLYDFDPSSLHPIGERWRNAVRRPNIAGYEVRAAFDTVEGVRYVVLDVPVRKEGEEERILAATSSFLGKKYWKHTHFPLPGQFKDDLDLALQRYISGMKLSTLTTGEMRSTMEGLSCLSVYADVQTVSDCQEMRLSFDTSIKSFTGGGQEFRYVAFGNALQKVVGTKPFDQ